MTLSDIATRILVCRTGFVRHINELPAMLNNYSMKNGPIFFVLNNILENLKYISLVELFKYLAVKLFVKNRNNDKKNTAKRYAVDIFIILKWFLVIYLLQNEIFNTYYTILIWYLIYSNLYTYFYYHVWHKDSMSTEDFLIDRVRRRFITLMLSIGFSNVCFAYLIRLPYVTDFNWSNNSSTNAKSLWFSLANSLTANYEYVKPNTEIGVDITIIQLIISFIFLTLILGKSIPQTHSTR
jgi:hypothetical protein